MSSKRKARSQRLNQELLDRARRQAFEEVEADETPEAEPEPEPQESAISAAPRPRPATNRAGRTSTAARLRARNADARKRALTPYEVAELLANPTKTVTEQELHDQYGFVLRDLRSMGLLAAASFGVLLLLAVVLPR
ncbi:MAG: hypothetical protein MUC99_01285 [Anaerolineae bacterium]|jgi:hypothetical protein|nr:hypothetical protein [Anaerolineae bacterium]